jgi:hypothetical protein
MRTLTVAVLAVAVTATFVPAHGATADVPRCHGHRATLVGTPDLELLRGTPGRDVIVTNGAGKVEARSGDDLICVTSGTFVNDGRGDDVIDARAVPTKNQIYATLSRGNDTYLGGRGEDSVNLSGGRDRVVLGAARDWITVYRTSPRSTLSLGAGTDVVEIRDERARFHVDAGAGVDRWWLSTEPKTRADSYVVDNTTGSLLVDGALTSTWTGFEIFWVEMVKLPAIPAPSNDFTFIGTAADEELSLAVEDSSASPYAGIVNAKVSMGEGDDELEVNGTVRGAVGLGDGHDLMTIKYVQSVDADLAAGTIDVVRYDDAGTRHFNVSGIEDLDCALTADPNDCEGP